MALFQKLDKSDWFSRSILMSLLYLLDFKKLRYLNVCQRQLWIQKKLFVMKLHQYQWPLIEEVSRTLRWACDGKHFCDTMVGFVSVLAQKTGSRREKDGPSEDRESLTKDGRREQSAWDSCPKKDRVSSRRQWEDGSRAVKRWVCIPSGFGEVSHKIHARDSWQMHGELHKSVIYTSPFLRLELTQARVCSLVLFLHPLGCVLRICKEMYNAPGPRWEKTPRWITGMSSLV